MKIGIILILSCFLSIAKANEGFTCESEDYWVRLSHVIKVNGQPRKIGYSIELERTAGGKINPVKMFEKCENLKESFAIPIQEIFNWKTECREVKGSTAYVKVKYIGYQLTEDGSKLIGRRPGILWFYPRGTDGDLIENDFLQIINPDAITKECYSP